MKRYERTGLAVLLLLASALPAQARDLTDPIAVAGAFGAALAAGDEAMVRKLLASDVLIYESGGQEASLEEYAAHHMKADMAFLAGAQAHVLERKHGSNDDLAWVATRSRITGTHKDKPVDILSTETLVLKRMPGGWRIVHVQWSSRPAESKAK